jgi:hypothetical protein
VTASISHWAPATAVSPIARPICQYEPAPLNSAAAMAESGAPEPAVRRLHVVPDPASTGPESTPPRDALVFADTALRRVLEVADRRRPAGQLKALVTPPLLDALAAQARQSTPAGTAVLQRVRLRTARHDGAGACAIELFATYTRGRRVLAAAGRIENLGGRWQLVALQLG